MARYCRHLARPRGIDSYILAWWRIWLLMPFFSLLLSTQVSAHALEQSYVFMNMNTESIGGRLEITVADLNRALSLELPIDKPVTLNDIAPYSGEIQEYFRSRVAISPNGAAHGLHLSEPELVTIPLAQYLVIPFSVVGFAGIPEYLDVEYRVLFDEHPGHRAFLVIEDNWKTGTFDNEAVISLIFDPQNTEQRLDLSSSTTAHGVWRVCPN